MKNNIRSLTILLLIFIINAPSFAQISNNQEKEAALLHNRYEFGQAMEIYKKLLEQCTDSLQRIKLESNIIQCENGLSLLEFAFEPNLVAKESFYRKQFFLHYPYMNEGKWIPLPKQFTIDTTNIGNGEFPVIYMPDNARELYYSAPDNSGSWNIYHSRLQGDTLWTAPQLLNENITSAGNELFPILSANGKSLYFTSNGHYGVGGYDLYVSEWDEELNDWGIPQNMGFPYSSPQDDLFFFNTPDGLFSIFASNRNCGRDSLVIYSVDFENIPLKREVTPQEASRIAKLELSGKKESLDNTNGVATGNKGENEHSKYTIAVNKVRDLQKRLAEALDRQAANRELYNTLTNPDDLRALEKKIMEQETATLTIQNEANAAMAELQVLEMEFLSKGMFIPNVEEYDAGKGDGSDKESVKFAFANMTLEKIPDGLNVEIPEPEIDLSFRISNEDAVVVELDMFPSGLVYQIQLFTLSKPASIKSLRGLSPVFERKNSSGRYIYYAGTFSKYSDALANLNKVRKRGFPSAIIVAYNNGKSLAVKNARILEKEIAESAVYQVTITGYTETLPQEVLSVIRATTEKDIARANDNGRLQYVVGPFGKEEDARLLVTALKAVSDKNIEIKKVE